MAAAPRGRALLALHGAARACWQCADQLPAAITPAGPTARPEATAHDIEAAGELEGTACTPCPTPGARGQLIAEWLAARSGWGLSGPLAGAAGAGAPGAQRCWTGSDGEPSCMGRGLAPHAAWPPQRRCYSGSTLVAATKKGPAASQSSSAGASGAAAEGAAGTPRRCQAAVNNTGKATASAAGGAGVVALLKARLGVEIRANHPDIPYVDRYMVESEEVLEGMIQAWGRDVTAAWAMKFPRVLRVPVWRQKAVLSRLMEGLGMTRADALRAIGRHPTVLQIQPGNVDARLAAALSALGGCGRAVLGKYPAVIGYDPVSLKASMDTLAAALGLACDDEAISRVLRKAPSLVHLKAERFAARVDAIAALWDAPREVVQATLRQHPTILALGPESLAEKAALVRGILASSGIPSWQAAASGPWTLCKLRTWLLFSEGRILRLRYLLDADLAHECPSPFYVAQMTHARWNKRFPGFAAWQTERAAGDGGAAALVDAPLTRRQP